MDPGVRTHGMKAGSPGYLWSKYERFLISGCQDMSFQKTYKLRLSVMGTRTRTTGATTIALLVLLKGELTSHMQILSHSSLTLLCWAWSLRTLGSPETGAICLCLSLISPIRASRSWHDPRNLSPSALAFSTSFLRATSFFSASDIGFSRFETLLRSSSFVLPSLVLSLSFFASFWAFSSTGACFLSSHSSSWKQSSNKHIGGGQTAKSLRWSHREQYSYLPDNSCIKELW